MKNNLYIKDCQCNLAVILFFDWLLGILKVYLEINWIQISFLKHFIKKYKNKKPPFSEKGAYMYFKIIFFGEQNMPFYFFPLLSVTLTIKKRLT